MSIKGRIQNLEKRVIHSKKVVQLPNITKDDLLFYDYSLYREARTALGLCFYFYEGMEEAKFWAKKIIDMEAMLSPKTRPAAYNVERAIQLQNEAIGQVWDKYPDIEKQCFKHYEPIRTDNEYESWLTALLDESEND